MSQDKWCIVLLTLAGFMLGVIITTVIIRPSSWLDAKLILSAFSGIGFMVGHLVNRVTRKPKDVTKSEEP